MGYSKQVYERAWAILDSRAQRVREERDALRRRALSAAPEIENIEREMASLAARSIHAAAASKGDIKQRIEELGRENLLLQERRARLLQEAGFPADCLSERFACMKCRDKGYVEGNPRIYCGWRNHLGMGGN